MIEVNYSDGGPINDSTYVPDLFFLNKGQRGDYWRYLLS